MPNRTSRSSRLFQAGLAVSIGVLVLDYATKWLVREWIMVGRRSISITDYFSLVLIGNPGVSFGMLGAADLSPILLSLVSFAVAVALVVWLYRIKERTGALALALLIGGALGNGLDRLRYGTVTDFLDFHLGGWHWPAFNVADICVVIGAALLMFESLSGGARTKVSTDAER